MNDRMARKKESIATSYCNAQKMKFSSKDIFSKYNQICSFLADLVTFTEENP